MVLCDIYVNLYAILQYMGSSPHIFLHSLFHPEYSTKQTNLPSYITIISVSNLVLEFRKIMSLKIFFVFVGMERLSFKPEGYKYWTWKGRKIHYVEEGNGVPVVLIHGFGASAFHWRFTYSRPFTSYCLYINRCRICA